jgi:hypothetical protein
MTGTWLEMARGCDPSTVSAVLRTAFGICLVVLGVSFAAAVAADEAPSCIARWSPRLG